ncbi:hypothetical protein H6501_04225 [Candidatus Woesearchaeota archaeon]|nr:hypothetical protein [Nanoarchaeota archaeon]MCB9370779.1 hypothetical protein [Candidatus Woesearchaeota archaeon]USN43880.1 MAG: hypothetical protein H6500_05825 [Candidatus Woesearchaeota archaeon]
MNKVFALTFLVFFFSFFLSSCSSEKTVDYCQDANGKTLSMGLALDLTKSSACTQVGRVVQENPVCEAELGRYRFDMQPFEEKANCDPECVVEIASQRVLLNWNCIG